MYNEPELSFALLTAFAAVARTLHFGHAARELGIAQPALSQHIRRIETIIGCSLLERDTRNVRLSPAGLILQELATRLPDELAAGLDRVRRAGRGEAGRITIGFTATTALRALPAAVQLHRSRYPDIELELIELLPDILSQRLTSGQIDIGLAREFIERPELGLIEAGHEPYVAVIPSTLGETETQRPLPLNRLRGEPFILFPTDHSSTHTERILQLCAKSGFTPHATMVVTSWQSAVSLVGVGLGVTILPACTSCLALPGTTFVSIDSDGGSRLDIVHRHGEERPAIWRFMQSAQEAIGAQ